MYSRVRGRRLRVFDRGQSAHPGACAKFSDNFRQHQQFDDAPKREHFPVPFLLREPPETIDYPLQRRTQHPVHTQLQLRGRSLRGFLRRDRRTSQPFGCTRYFPRGLNITIQGVGSPNHTWNNETMADTLSSGVRGSVPSQHSLESYPCPRSVSSLGSSRQRYVCFFVCDFSWRIY
jgi:hypothetical protein